MIRRRPASSLRRILAIALGAAAVFGPSVPAQAAATWSKNIYVSTAFLYQDPYSSGCTAASTMIMLNTIAYRHSGGPGFRWTSTRIKSDPNKANVRDLASILYFSRGHDTLALSGSGSDPHGWRNALNYYGWGAAAMTNPALSVYKDQMFTSFDVAVRAAVRSIAIYRMPVGIVSWAGRHAQVMTGYVVDGEDPAVSDNFTVRYVYISDPLRSDAYVNAKITYNGFKVGNLHVRFQRYRETDSPYDDGYTSGYLRSSVSSTRGPSEWYGRWVIIAAVRAGLPIEPPPPPDPTPTPPAEPTPTPTPPPDPTSTPQPTATPDATAATIESSPSTEPRATAAPTPAPSGTPEASPPPAPTEAPSTIP